MDKVHVLCVRHRHGDSVSVHATRAGADLSLLGYVKKEWEQEIDSPLPVDLPGMELIKRYFDKVEDEYAETFEREVRSDRESI